MTVENQHGFREKVVLGLTSATNKAGDKIGAALRLDETSAEKQGRMVAALYFWGNIFGAVDAGTKIAITGGTLGLLTACAGQTPAAITVEAPASSPEDHGITVTPVPKVEATATQKPVEATATPPPLEPKKYLAKLRDTGELIVIKDRVYHKATVSDALIGGGFEEGSVEQKAAATAPYIVITSDAKLGLVSGFLNDKGELVYRTGYRNGVWVNIDTGEPLPLLRVVGDETKLPVNLRGNLPGTNQVDTSLNGVVTTLSVGQTLVDARSVDRQTGVIGNETYVFMEVIDPSTGEERWVAVDLVKPVQQEAVVTPTAVPTEIPTAVPPTETAVPTAAAGVPTLDKADIPPTPRAEPTVDAPRTYIAQSPIPLYSSATEANSGGNFMPGTGNTFKIVGEENGKYKIATYVASGAGPFYWFINKGDLGKAVVTNGGGERPAGIAGTYKIQGENPIWPGDKSMHGLWREVDSWALFGPDRYFLGAYGLVKEGSFDKNQQGNVVNLRLQTDFNGPVVNVVLTQGTGIYIYDQENGFRGIVNLDYLTEMMQNNDEVIVYLASGSPVPSSGGTVEAIGLMLNNYNPARHFQ